MAELVACSTPEAPTASALCELAGVSRNALYRYHPDVLHELHKLQRPDAAAVTQARPSATCSNCATKTKTYGNTWPSSRAALVDHYFAAWQETSSLLRRRERELADLRRNTKPKLVSIRT